MERLTKRLENGGYDAGERTLEEIIAELGKYEDFMESVEAELELVNLNLEALRSYGKQRSATYTMLRGSGYMLEEMQKRIAEPSAEVAARLESLRKMIDEDPDGDGIHDVGFAGIIKTGPKPGG